MPGAISIDSRRFGRREIVISRSPRISKLESSAVVALHHSIRLVFSRYIRGCKFQLTRPILVP
jgi:hypothetical protein